MGNFAEGTPTVEITLGGKSYTLGWTWGSKRRLKEHLKAHGVDLQSADAAVFDNLPAVVWSAMDEESRSGISISQIEELLNPRNEEEVMKKLVSLFTQSEPAREPDPNL
jgi:hypothetical protein